MPGYALRTGVVVLMVSALQVQPVFSASKQSTQERLERIERQLDSRGLVDMLNRIEQLQRDVQQLRGDLDVQAHTLEDIQRRQRELYLDVDRRLQQLETGQPAAAVTPPPPPTGVEALTPPPPALPVRTPPPPALPVRTPAPATPVRTPAPATPAAGGNEQAEYEKALAVLREGQYAEAETAFSRFLADYPGSSYVDNANYWLGETYYVTRDFDRALSTFNKLVEFYPQSPKVPAARLKTGYIHYEMKNWAAARKELGAVVSGFPGTTEARLAGDRLQRMKKEGH